ncbi:MAG: TetR/AcrR family transcriptional regulator [Desulfobacterales bacterium]|nr:TetR/AcrR family transcriptional regulator [Desulfobacterales bacterium]
MTKKKDLILEAATILFAEKGFNETSVADLARITHSAEGTIFYHFKNKNELLVAILEDVKEGILAEFSGYMRECRFDTGLEMIEGVIGFFLYLAGKKEQWFRLLQRHYPYEFARSSSDGRGHLEAIYNTLVDLFEEAIRRGLEDGSIRDLPERKTALILFSMVNGLIWLKYHDLYEPATLYEELLSNCKRMLSPDSGSFKEEETGSC